MSPTNPRDLPWEKNEKILGLFQLAFLSIGLLMWLLVSTEVLDFKDAKYIFEGPGLRLVISFLITLFSYWFIMLFPGLLVYH